MSSKVTIDSSDIRSFDRVIALLTFLIVIGKALPWITLALASWSLYLGTLDVLSYNWVWAVVNILLALGGYSFVLGLVRKSRNQQRMMSPAKKEVIEYQEQPQEAEVA